MGIDDRQPSRRTRNPSRASSRVAPTPAWVFTTLRVLAVAVAIYIAWYVAGHWDRWAGASALRNDRRRFHLR